MYWALGNGDATSLVLHDFATRELLDPMVKLPARWERCVDQGILKNLSAIADSVMEKTLARKLKEVG